MVCLCGFCCPDCTEASRRSRGSGEVRHAAVQTFDTPQSAADALVKAAADFDEIALVRIFGPDGKDIVFTGELPQDRKHAADFAQEAQEKL